MSAREPECPRCVDAAPYVLGALEDGDAYRAHLDACPVCRVEVAELQQAVDALPASAAPVAASRALRERVLATVRSEAELLKAAGAGAEQPPRRATSSRSRRSQLLPAGVAIAAVVAVIVVITVIASGGGTPLRERVTPAQIATVASGASASLRQRDGRADLIVSNMPPPPVGKIYEVWLSRGAGPPRPTDALFSVTSAGSGAVDVPYDLHGVREVLVTSEPLGGSLRPTSPPVIRVVLAT